MGSINPDRKMPEYKSAIVVAASIALVFSSVPAGGVGTAVSSRDKSSATLEARLDAAETDFKNGKVSEAIEQASKLIDVTDDSIFKSDLVAQKAKADLAIFQLKAGHPDVSAALIRQLLLNLQLDGQADPKFALDPAQVHAGAPAIMKEYYSQIIDRLYEPATTRDTINALIDNTFPKDYSKQLKAYCAHLKEALEQLETFRSTADSEELHYGDPLFSLADDGSVDDSDAHLSVANLEKMGKKMDELAQQGQDLPVGDLRAVHGLYTLTLLANSAKHYDLAENFAQLCVKHANAIAEHALLVDASQIAQAYSLLKQGKTQEFKSMRDDVLKRLDDQERMLICLARFTQLSGDKSGAADIYKRALDLRARRGPKSPPDWMDSYNELLKQLSDAQKLRP
jgi:hypothetical protein